MTMSPAELEVAVRGPGRFDSPMAALLGDRQTSAHYVNADDRVLVDDTLAMAAARGVAVSDLPAFEAGGPRRRIYFEPARTRVAMDPAANVKHDRGRRPQPAATSVTLAFPVLGFPRVLHFPGFGVCGLLTPGLMP